MEFNEFQIEGKVVQFSLLEDVMREHHMIRGGQWDWERVTYDHKFEFKHTGDVYYLRVQGVAVEGEIEQPDAMVQLKTPILGHHYYPHGIEYDETFPEHLVNKCREKLAELEKALAAVETIYHKNLTTEQLTQELLDVSGVKNVKDLHMWTTHGTPFLTCHLIVENGRSDRQVIQEASERLREKFEIERTTIQIDRPEAQLEQETS